MLQPLLVAASLCEAKINYPKGARPSSCRFGVASRAEATAACFALRESMPHETLRAVPTNIWFWIAFHAGVFIALAIDLTSFKHRGRELSMRAASFRSVVWIVLSLSFNVVVWKTRGADQGLDFLTAYLIEYSLSVDNIFVFVLIFTYFRVPPMSQHRVLVWGIVGALIMRGIMIGLGVALVTRFHFILYIFGIFLVVTAVRMFFGKQEETDFGKNWLMRFCRRSVLCTNDFHGEHFTARVDGRFMLTPLALVLLLVDVMDLIFAVDSIPAVFAITQDIFIIYTSNVCAILGLRSLYFLLAKMVDRFVYLKTGVSILLGFIGMKMILADIFHIPNVGSLAIIVLVLAVTITVSMIATRRKAKAGK
jgi:tellurite resistance protein TerC